MTYPLVKEGIDTMPEAGVSLVATAMNFRTKSVAAKALLITLCDGTGMGSSIKYPVEKLAEKLNCTVERLEQLIYELEGQRVFKATFHGYSTFDGDVTFNWYAPSSWLPCPPEDVHEETSADHRRFACPVGRSLPCLTNI